MDFCNIYIYIYRLLQYIYIYIYCVCVCGGGGGGGCGGVYSVYDGLRYFIKRTLAKTDFLSTEIRSRQLKNRNMQLIVFYASVKFHQNIPYSNRASGQNSCFIYGRRDSSR